MKNLSIGIYNKFKVAPTNTFYTSLSGRMYRENAPQGATAPYATYSIISDVPDWTFDKEYEDVRVQFSIFTNDLSPNTAETIYGYLKSLYDWCTLTISGNVFVYMKRVNYTVFKDSSDGSIGCHVDYKVMMEKS